MMYCNNSAVVVLKLFILVCTSQVSSLLFFCKKPDSWKNAFNDCRTNYGGRVTNQIPKGVLSQLSPNSILWSGRYSTLSDWINYIGCYNEEILDEVKPVAVFHGEPSVAACHKRCLPVDLFALQMNKCLCINKKNETLLSDSHHCNVTCTGSYDSESCGGLNHLSVYRHFNQANDKSLNFKKCSYSKCDNTTYRGQLIAEECNKLHYTLCGTDDGNSFFTQTNWFSAEQQCRQRGSYLYRNKSAVGFCNKYQHTEALKLAKGFWTAVHRFELLNPHTDNTSLFYRCGIFRIVNGVISSEMRVCQKATQTYSYICETDNTPSLRDDHCSILANVDKQTGTSLLTHVTGVDFISNSSQQKDNEAGATIPTHITGVDSTVASSQQQASKTGLIGGLVFTSLLSAVCILVLIITLKPRLQKYLNSKPHKKPNFNMNASMSTRKLTLENEYESNYDRLNIEGSDETNDKTIPKDIQPTIPATVGYNMLEKSPVTEEPLYDGSVDKAEYDNSVKTDDMYYEMSTEPQVEYDIPPIRDKETSTVINNTSHNDRQSRDNPLPNDLEGIYDTAVANIIFSSLRKNSEESREKPSAEDNDGYSVVKDVQETDERKDVPYVEMDGSEIREDNYKEMEVHSIKRKGREKPNIQ